MNAPLVLAPCLGLQGKLTHIYHTEVLHVVPPASRSYRRCSAKMDIYSFGVVLWEIASGRPAVRGHVNLPLDASEAPEDLCRIIEACMQRDPEQRPDVRDLYRFAILLASRSCVGFVLLAWGSHCLLRI